MTKQEQILNDSRYVPLHNNGFVGLIDHMGDDSAIAQAARVSYGGNMKTVAEDRNLIRYLMRHRHTSPFEMGEVKFHIALPIFIMRQLVRHRTANLNEYSGRYSEMSDEFYIPSLDYILPQSKTNKQGRGGALCEEDREAVANLIKGSTDSSYIVYRTLLGKEHSSLFSPEFDGISNELARMVLPVANYTECYWKMDLHNFFHFAKLRMDSHAQQEIRDFATTMFEMVKPIFPLATEAFEDYVYNARTLSRMDILAITDMLAGTFVNNADHYGMSKREFTELVEFFRPTADHSRNILAT